MSELEVPNSWAAAAFGQVAHVDAALVDPAEFPDVPHIAPDNIAKGSGKLIGYKTVREDKVASKNYRFRSGQLLYSKIRPYLVKVIHVEFEGLCSADMYPISTRLDAKFLLHWMLSESFTQFAVSAKERALLPKINRAELEQIPVPVPPLPEQRRIVAKIASTFQRIEAIDSAVDAADKLLAKYRESLLNKAFRGELVPQDPSDDPASKLLERMRAERSKQQGVKKASDLPTIERDKIPFEIPESWEWVRLGELGDLSRGKSKHRPRNDPKLFGGEYPFIQTGEVAGAKFGVIKAYSQTLSEFGFKQSRLFAKGTLCITIAANIADAAILGFDSCFPDSVVGLTFFADQTLRRRLSLYVMHYFELMQTAIDRVAPGAAQKNINLDFLELLPVPIPPSNEIERIVELIERSIETRSQVTDTVGAISKACSDIRGSTLRAAFSGRLVPQVPTEGTGHELLKQCLAAKVGDEPTKPGKASKTPRKKQQ